MREVTPSPAFADTLGDCLQASGMLPHWLTFSMLPAHLRALWAGAFLEARSTFSASQRREIRPELLCQLSVSRMNIPTMADVMEDFKSDWQEHRDTSPLLTFERWRSVVPVINRRSPLDPQFALFTEKGASVVPVLWKSFHMLMHTLPEDLAASISKVAASQVSWV